MERAQGRYSASEDPADELISRIRVGDECAFEQIYLQYFDELWRYAYRFVRSSDQAQDLVQDVFVSLLRQGSRLVIHSTLRAYLYGSVRNHALMALRREKMVDRVTETAIAENDILGIGSNDFSPDKDITERDQRNILQNKINALPARQKLAFTLRWDGMSVAEIAESMGISVVAVRKLLEKAIIAVQQGIVD